MRADHVEVSWDAGKRKWLIRIEVGSEVIRRYCDQSRDTDSNRLREAAERTVVDEGYAIDTSKISIMEPGGPPAT